MVGKENLKTEHLNLCFEKLMMSGKVKEGRVMTDWKDIPMELLLQILTLVDDQTVITASGVCRGWRDALCLGITRLSLSCATVSFGEMDFSFVTVGNPAWIPSMGVTRT